MMTRLLAAAAAFAFCLPAFAQESSGTITGAYNADDAVWTVGTPESEEVPESGWRPVEDGIEVTLVGMPGPAELDRQNGTFDRTLVVSFTLEGQPQELRMAEPMVWMVSDAHEERLMAQRINIDLSVTAAEITGEDLALAGDLVAILTPGGRGDLTIESEELATEDAVLIDGNFQATLTRLGEDDGADEEDDA